jgi:ribonuclease HI
MQLIQLLKVRLDRDEFIEAMLVLRSIWLRRNNYVFQGKFTPPSQVILKAKSLAAICAETQQEALPEKSAVEKTPSRWRAPGDGWLKVNWDATLQSQTKKMGIGVVVRNGTGEVKAALANVLPLVDDPTAAEAIAAWFAVKLSVDCGFQLVVLEGDSMAVVSAINQASPNWSSYGHFVEDIKVLAQSVHWVEINYASRVVNSAAHTLAKCAILHSLDELWMEECPSYIRSIVLAEQVSSL